MNPLFIFCLLAVIFSNPASAEFEPIQKSTTGNESLFELFPETHCELSEWTRGEKAELIQRLPVTPHNFDSENQIIWVDIAGVYRQLVLTIRSTSTNKLELEDGVWVGDTAVEQSSSWFYQENIQPATVLGQVDFIEIAFTYDRRLLPVVFARFYLPDLSSLTSQPIEFHVPSNKKWFETEKSHTLRLECFDNSKI